MRPIPTLAEQLGSTFLERIDRSILAVNLSLIALALLLLYLGRYAPLAHLQFPAAEAAASLLGSTAMRHCIEAGISVPVLSGKAR
jgi:hypothetical protein